MKTTIHYTQSTRQERLQAGLKDAHAYIRGSFRPGTLARFQDTLRQIWAEPTPRRQRARLAYMALSFAGIEGLPATAMIKEAITQVSSQ